MIYADTFRVICYELHRKRITSGVKDEYRGAGLVKAQDTQMVYIDRMGS